VKVRLSDLAFVESLSLETGGNITETGPIGIGAAPAVIDTVRGYAYFVTKGNGPSPTRIVRVRLSDFAVAGALSLHEVWGFSSAIIDATNGFAYFGGGSGTGPLVYRVEISAQACSPTTTTSSHLTSTTATMTKSAQPFTISGYDFPAILIGFILAAIFLMMVQRSRRNSK